MKRFAFWFLAALVAISVVRTSHRHDRSHPSPRVVVIHDRDGQVTRTIVGSPADEIENELREAAEQVREAARDAAEEARDAAREAREAAREAAEEARDAADDARNQAREFVQGLPVPVVRGSRVTEARPEPPAPPKPPRRRKAPPVPVKAPKVEVKVDPITITGRLSATEDRAKADARVALIETIREKLDGQVPSSWPIPDDFLDAMTREVKISTVEKEYGTLYEAKLTVDASPARLEDITSRYRHEHRLKRLAVLGGGLLFLLVGLGTFSGYVRADEATKGYYTKRLRLVAAAGLGAAGLAIYRVLT
ncbi:MAG: hypothetical protein AB7I30_16440 [Isosphaeraceae bacterium]